jgi:hypothetical protein
MRILVALVVAGLANSLAVAEDGAVKMTRAELLSFLPGTKVTHVNSGGSTRIWTNRPDGTLMASSDGKKYGGAFGAPGSSSGTWKVNDEGQFCISIDWKREAENWCSSILKTADGYYLAKVDPRRKIEFAK